MIRLCLPARAVAGAPRDQRTFKKQVATWSPREIWGSGLEACRSEEPRTHQVRACAQASGASCPWAELVRATSDVHYDLSNRQLSKAEATGTWTHAGCNSERQVEP